MAARPASRSVLLSSTIWAARPTNGPFFLPGRAHYSYELARRKFERALNFCGFDCYDVPRPEIYAPPIARELFGEHRAHLMFKPPEMFRLLKGAWNVACVPWEFDELVLPRRPGRHMPFADMRHMLTLPDEIWTPSEFSRAVFERSGIGNAHRVPAPIEPPGRTDQADVDGRLDDIRWINLRIGFGRYRETTAARSPRPTTLPEILSRSDRGGPPEIFLTVLNPHDLRKDVSALVTGFVEFHFEHRNALLLVKLIVDGVADRLDTVLDGIIRRRLHGFEFIDSDAIWLTTDHLPEDVLAALYRRADAYVSATLAEGQNLPLLEAMAAGIVPIAPAHTAMTDYIDGQNAVVIASSRTPIDRPDTAVGPYSSATWYVSTPTDIADALRRFHDLPRSGREALAARATATVERGYSVAAVAARIAERLAAPRSGASR